MIHRKLGASELNCSVVAVGTWGMAGDFWGKTDEQESVEAIRASLDSGVNLIDTAPIYGRGYAEQLVSMAIAGRKRDNFLIATKCGLDFVSGGRFNNLSRPSLLTEIDASLQRLKTDYVDLYQVHWPDPETPIPETFSALKEIQESGKVRYIGVSNFDVKQMEEARKYCEIVSLQPPYSLLDRVIEEEILPYCKSENIGVLSYGSIGAGALTGKFKDRPLFEEGDKRGSFYRFFDEERWPKTRAMIDVLEDIGAERGRETVEVAINWVLKQSGVTVALVGARNAAQAKMNAKAGEWELSDEENARIEASYREIFA